MQHVVVNYGKTPLTLTKRDGEIITLQRDECHVGELRRIEVGSQPTTFTLAPSPKLGPLTDAEVAEAREQRIPLPRSLVERLLTCAAPVLSREDGTAVHAALIVRRDPAR